MKRIVAIVFIIICITLGFAYYFAFSKEADYSEYTSIDIEERKSPAFVEYEYITIDQETGFKKRYSYKAYYITDSVTVVTTRNIFPDELIEKSVQLNYKPGVLRMFPKSGERYFLADRSIKDDLTYALLRNWNKMEKQIDDVNAQEVWREIEKSLDYKKNKTREEVEELTAWRWESGDYIFDKSAKESSFPPPVDHLRGFFSSRFERTRDEKYNEKIHAQAEMIEMSAIAQNKKKYHFYRLKDGCVLGYKYDKFDELRPWAKFTLNKDSCTEVEEYGPDGAIVGRQIIKRH